MSILNTLTAELYNEHPAKVQGLRHEAMDPTSTYKTAKIFGNPDPRPAKTALYDKSLRGTGTLAYNIDPQDVKSVYPAEGMQLEREIGPYPLIGINPDMLKIKDEDFRSSVLHHEKGHSAQPGKMKLKTIHAFTDYGLVPLGLMLIEGGVEWALERRGIKSPTSYWDKTSRIKQPYSIYRDFVRELDEKQPGIMRQIYRVASRASP
ncbi:MAG: hypothetical protein NT120_00540, partial [Candidatus Aenigmarchaeota archaeon]|nr:hypothetical protein [Candidatus Aenigmarchaeota archaeon]